MSNARIGRVAPVQGRADSTRTKAAKATTVARHAQRHLKGWAPVPFDAARIAADLAGTR